MRTYVIGMWHTVLYRNFTRDVAMSSYLKIEEIHSLSMTSLTSISVFLLAPFKSTRFILASGFISLFAGLYALFSPVIATVVTVEFLAVGLIVVGLFSMSGIFWAERCYRCASFVSGTLQFILGIVMTRNIIESMVVLTGLLAFLYIAMGVFQCGLALKTRLPNWGSYLASGICNILFSIIVLSAFPLSATYTIGIIVGVNWVSTGFFRISLGFQGRAAAKSLMGSSAD